MMLEIGVRLPSDKHLFPYSCRVSQTVSLAKRCAVVQKIYLGFFELFLTLKYAITE